MFSAFKIGFLVSAALFVVSAVTMASLYDKEISTANSFTAGSSSNTDIALNEIYANPPGSAESNGEWVEVYNIGSWAIDLNGWYLYDKDGHSLQITSANVTGGSTLVSAKGYLVVNRNGDPYFSLNNSNETIYLYDGIIDGGALIDSKSYPTTIEDKSWSRIPNGTGAWSDGHTPTPGGPNV
jgi:predicted ribosomally synthesized peptide with SipW-like signal peptide